MMNIGFIAQHSENNNEHDFGYILTEDSDSNLNECLTKSNIVAKQTKKQYKNPFQKFIDDLPSYKYDKQMIKENQEKINKKKENEKIYSINMLDTNNNRFLNYYEAFLYIAEHCLKHGQKFTRDTCKQYLKQCYIIDFAHDNFIPITTHMTQKLFNKYFRLIQRELKFI